VTLEWRKNEHGVSWTTEDYLIDAESQQILASVTKYQHDDCWRVWQHGADMGSFVTEAAARAKAELVAGKL
jgi:hypothetical protein